MSTDPIMHPDLFRKESPIVTKRPRDRSAFRKFRDMFHYHYNSGNGERCNTCKFSFYNSGRKRWTCSLQGGHRTGPYWVCLNWISKVFKGGSDA
jgi:hypothetical protein